MSIIKSLQGWFNACPVIALLSKDGISIDFTDSRAEDFSLAPAGEAVIKRYIDGSSVRQYSFTLEARRYTLEDANRLENVEFLEQLSKWLEEKTRSGTLPDIGTDLESLEIVSSFSSLMATDAGNKTGLYQVPCTLTYRTKG